MTESVHAFERLSIVVPAFNEAQAVGPTLAELVAATPGAEIILIDDHSSDATSTVARSVPGVTVRRHDFNRGQGASLKTGMRLATRDYVAWFDSDGEHRVEDLCRMYSRILDEDLVAVIGQRVNGSASATRAFGKWVIRLIGQSLKIKAGSDLNCGLRIFRRDAFARYAELIPDRFSSSMVSTLVLLERRYPIAFETIVTNPRIGHSTVQLKDGFEAILQLLRAVLLFSPMRFFLPLGGAAFALGVVYSLLMAASTGLGVPVAGLLLVVSGLLTIFFGLIADQISQLRLNQLNAAPPMERIDGDDRSTP
ncbi:MAG: hypothetical protein C0511_09155 [Hyphomicrobium sp.]|nr:hypothetical protein [Hyphomicrobium sp.]